MTVATEQTGFVANALQKKWQTLKARYEYDPAQDYRRGALRETETGDSKCVLLLKLSADEDGDKDKNKEICDSEDLKAKIIEIVGGSRAMFRRKSEDGI